MEPSPKRYKVEDARAGSPEWLTAPAVPDKCDALVLDERKPSPAGTRPSLSLGPSRSNSSTVTQYFYGGAQLEPAGDGRAGSTIMDFGDAAAGGRPPPGTGADLILREYDLGPLARAQLHVFPTPGLELQALRNGDRKHVFGEILFSCGGTQRHPPFVVSKKYLPSRPVPRGAANDLFTYILEYPAETRRLWPQLWAQLLAVGAALHQGGRGIVHHDIKPENLVVETWRLDPPAVRLRLIDFEHARDFPARTTAHALYALKTAQASVQQPLPQGVHPFSVSPKGNHTPAYAAAPVQLPVLRRSAAAGADQQNVWSIELADMWSIAMTAYVAFTGTFMVPLQDASCPHYVILSEMIEQMQETTRPRTVPWNPATDTPWDDAAPVDGNTVVEVRLEHVGAALQRAAGRSEIDQAYADEIYALFQLCSLLAIRALPLDQLPRSSATARELVDAVRELDARQQAAPPGGAPPPLAPPGTTGAEEGGGGRRSVWDVLRA